MMEKDLSTLAAAGVVVEFFGPLGHLIAQEVFFDWRGAPIPAVGDAFECELPPGASRRLTKIVGEVRSRHFDVQRGDGGEPQVWVRLAVDVRSSSRHRAGRSADRWHSVN